MIRKLGLWLPLFVQVIYMTGWREHPSQQKAKRRGSATISFSDIQKEFAPSENWALLLQNVRWMMALSSFVLFSLSFATLLTLGFLSPVFPNPLDLKRKTIHGGKKRTLPTASPKLHISFIQKSFIFLRVHICRKQVRFCCLYQFSVGNHLICINHDPAANSSAWEPMLPVVCSFILRLRKPRTCEMLRDTTTVIVVT